MKGFENIASTVEISPEWKEKHGCIVGVSIAESINPNRIEGVSKFEAYKMSVLSNHIDLPIISDHKFKERSFDDIVKEGYFRKSEIKNVKQFVVIRGMLLSPWGDNSRPCLIHCSMYDKNNKKIASITKPEKSGRAVFKYMGSYFGGSDIKMAPNTHFTFVFGFNSKIQPSKINIFPGGHSLRFGDAPHWWWYMDKDLFPRENIINERKIEERVFGSDPDDDIPF